MTAPIFFNIEEARTHLLEHGYVYTVRKKRSTGITRARHGSFFKFRDLGKVEITHVEHVRWPADLESYVKESGFRSVPGWASCIFDMHWAKDCGPDSESPTLEPEPVEMELYLVSRIWEELL